MSRNEVLTGARTLWELVERRAEASPDHLMLIAPDGETVTFGAFRDRAARVAAGLFEMGIGTDSVVSWQLPTRIDTIVASIALSRLGAVQNPIIHLYREREVGFALKQTKATLFMILSQWRGANFGAIADTALEGAPGRPTILTIDDGLPEADPAILPPAPQGVSPEATPIRWIYYTSGSTADPKGVQHTDQTLIAGGWGLARALQMTPDDVGSIAFPFAHIAGPDYLVTMLSFGFPAILVEAFSVPDVLPLFRQHGATMVGGSTDVYVLRVLGRAAQEPRSAHLADIAADVGGRCGQAPRSPLRGARRDWRARRRPRLWHDRGPDDLERLADRHGRTAGQYRRQTSRRS